MSAFWVFIQYLSMWCRAPPGGHPCQPGGWRPPRLLGAPHQLGGMRLNKPRGFRDCGIGFGSWTFSMVSFIVLILDLFSKNCLWMNLIFIFFFINIQSKIEFFCFVCYFSVINSNPVPPSSMKSRLFQVENFIFVSLFIYTTQFF